MRISAICILIVLLCWPLSSAWSKSTEERVSDLEKRLSAIQQTYLTNNAEIASAISRSQTIQQEFASVKGSVETNRHLIDSQRKDLMQMLRDLEHRLQAIEDRMEIFATQINMAIGKVSPKVADEGRLYQSGLSKANRGEYISAVGDFESFIKKYPKSTFAPNAQYWIGECYFSMKNFKRSIKEFQVFIEKNPRNEKIPAAILQQGNGFYELGMLDQAKPFYEKVIKDYPHSPEATTARTKLELVSQRKAGMATTTQPRSGYPTETIQQQKERYRQNLKEESQGTSQTTSPKKKSSNRHYTEF